ncbi:MAG: uracil-DNA glycosylase [Kiritimatiellia bacterium]
MAELPEILAAFEQALTLEAELGTRMVDCDRALLVPLRPAPPPAAPVPSAAAAPAGRESAVSPAPPPLRPAAAEQAADLPTAEELAACTKCPLARAGRTHVVPGQGNANGPDYMFIGEAPGAEEDARGLAFVGAAGQFLTKMIAAMGYERDQVFIANVCKCRPPGNRTPNPQEMAACLPYLRRQIARIRPKCIILLGRTAMTGLFPATRIRRDTWYAYEGIPVIATFHPAYILRFDSATDPAGLRLAKVAVWNVLKMALARLGKTPPPLGRK